MSGTAEVYRWTLAQALVLVRELRRSNEIGVVWTELRPDCPCARRGTLCARVVFCGGQMGERSLCIAVSSDTCIRAEFERYASSSLNSRQTNKQLT